MIRRSLTAVCFAWTLSACAATAAPESDLFQLFLQLSTDHRPSGTETIAVMPFVTEKNIDPSIGRVIAEQGIAFFANKPGYQVVERIKFQEMIAELKLSMSGLMDSSTVLEAGKFMAAKLLVTGTVGDAFGRRLVIARIVRTETGEVLASSSATINSVDLDQFSKDALGESMKPSSSIFRSIVLPGWGQFYADKPGQGVVFGVLALGAVGGLAGTVVNWSAKETDLVNLDADRKTTAQYTADSLGAEVAARRAYSGMVACIGITAGVWVVNIIDAAIVGKMRARVVRQRYFSFYIDPLDHAAQVAFEVRF